MDHISDVKALAQIKDLRHQHDCTGVAKLLAEIILTLICDEWPDDMAVPLTVRPTNYYVLKREGLYVVCLEMQTATAATTEASHHQPYQPAVAAVGHHRGPNRPIIGR